MDLADASAIVRLAFMEHYHMRSNIESAFSMIKGKFGDSVRSKSDTGQVNEALCKMLRCSAILPQHLRAHSGDPRFGRGTEFWCRIPSCTKIGGLEVI